MDVYKEKVLLGDDEGWAWAEVTVEAGEVPGLTQPISQRFPFKHMGSWLGSQAANPA